MNIGNRILNTKFKSLKILIILSVFFFISLNSNAQNKTFKNQIGSLNHYTEAKITQNIDLAQDKIVIFNSWWINVLFVFAFYLLTFFTLQFFDELSIIIKSFLNKALFEQIISQKNSVYNNLFSFFNVSSIILFSTLIFTFFIKIKSPFTNTSYVIQYLSIVLFVSISFFLLILFSNIWAFLFNEKKIKEIYITNIKISNIIFFVILLLFLFFIYSSSQCNINCFKFIFIIIITIYSIRTFNLLRDFFNNGFSLFYLILYLCTVEIFPGLIIYKTFLTEL